MSKNQLLITTVLLPLLTTIILLYWYQWSADILSPHEVDQYMNVIEGQTQKPGAKHNLLALRQFLSEDDGKPFYTVNLYNFHEIADYPGTSGFSGTGTDAYDRFSQVMIPLMARRGSHPIFGSYWSDLANSNWDRIVIVRYRSRRDLADLFATDQFAEASRHKWASLREHHRMLVQATHIPDGKIAILLIAVFLGISTQVAGRAYMRRQVLKLGMTTN